jgi:signal transduction histidine kinase/methyl-accepting chemotaxis protein
MLVKQRLRINAFVSVVSVLAIFAVFVLTTYRVNRAFEASKIADAIITTAFERLLIRTDYHRTGSERSMEQLIAKHEQIGDLLKAASEKFTDPEDKKTISELLTSHESIGKFSKTIRENREKSGPRVRPDALSRELEDRLLNQLNMRVYETVLLGSRLQESSNEAVIASLKLAVGGILFVLLLVGTAMLINSRAMGRAITDRVSRLREGVSVVGVGKLDHRIDIKGDDELAELSEAFNEMTAKLSGSYNDLEKEIQSRKQAEESLNRLNVELSQRVAEQTAEVRRANESLEQHVIERTAELQAANDNLRASRVAALNLMEDALAARAAVLNLMEDAVAARHQAEAASVELQNEITVRKEAERILQTTYERFYNVLSGMYAAILLVSADDQVEFANKAFYDMFGLEGSPADIKGITSQEMILKIRDVYPNPDEAIARIAEIVEQGKPVIGEEVAKSDGRTCLRDFIPIFDGDKLYGRLWQHVDITERKRAEYQLQQSNVELEAANNEMEAFIYSVSHDLRAPIRAISGFSSMLLSATSDRLAQKEQGYLSRISAGAEKMSQLLDGLLNLSRISRQETTKVDVDLSKIVTKLAAEIGQDNPGRKVELVVEEGLTAFADPQLIEIALVNLLGNAWKFTSKTDDARVEFGASEKDGRIIYFVRDNGVGFDEKFAGKMFWPFHRLHSGAEFEGTGIGLAIVERVVRRHGGQVWAEGAEGQGATIYFTLG